MLYLKRRIKFLCIVLICSLLCSCAEKQTAETAPQAVAVETVRAEIKPYNENLNSFGTISYKTKNDVTALVGGTIDELRFREGDTVSAGQILAVLRNVQLELQRDQAENALDSAKSAHVNILARKWDAELQIETRLLSLERADMSITQKELELENAREKQAVKQDLFSIGGITESAFKDVQLGVLSAESQVAVMKKEREISALGLRDSDLSDSGIIPASGAAEKKKQLVTLNTRSIRAELAAAAASVKNAEKSLKSVERLLEELRLASPVSGVIGARYYEAGEYVKENEKVFTIMDTRTVSAVFSIQEQDIGFFAAGTPVVLVIPSLDKKVDSKVSEISPMADPESGNFTVKADIPNRDGSLKPGMFVRCTAARSEVQFYVALPEAVLVKKNGNTASVFTVVNNRLVLRDLQIKIQKDGLLWVSSGIEVDAEVVLKPSPFLKEGQLVTY